LDLWQLNGTHTPTQSQSPSPSGWRLALFDLDYTLLPVDSDYEWGEFLVRAGQVDGDRYRARNDDFFVQYKAGTLDIFEFLAFSLEPLGRIPPAELAALHARFMAETIRPHMHDAARALIARHRAAGDLCAVVTATNAFVTAPIARAFGIEHLIATVPARENGRFTGGVRGTPCFREGKITRVNAWLESMGLDLGSFTSSCFYSDSRNDLALLEQVSDPVATNADDALSEIAASRGWRTLNLFNDQSTVS